MTHVGDDGDGVDGGEENGDGIDGGENNGDGGEGDGDGDCKPVEGELVEPHGAHERDVGELGVEDVILIIIMIINQDIQRTWL